MINPYIPKNSIIHKLNPRVKLTLTLGLIVLISISQNDFYPGFILILSILISLAILSEIRITYFLKRALLISPFFLAALPLPFFANEPYIFVNIGTITYHLSEPGITRFLAIIIKSFLSVNTAILLITTTQFNDILMAMHSLYIPRILIQVFGLMWRYLFVIVDQAKTLLSARNSRSGTCLDRKRHVGGSLMWRAKVTGNMVGSLLQRSLEQSERIYYAMLSRGYEGEPRPIYSELGLSDIDHRILRSGLLVLIFLFLIGTLF